MPRQIAVFPDQIDIILLKGVVLSLVTGLGVVAAHRDDVDVRAVQLALLVHGVFFRPVFAGVGIPEFVHRYRVAVQIHTAVDHHPAVVHPIGGDGEQLGGAIAEMGGFADGALVVGVVLRRRTAHTEVFHLIIAAAQHLLQLVGIGFTARIAHADGNAVADAGDFDLIAVFHRHGVGLAGLAVRRGDGVGHRFREILRAGFVQLGTVRHGDIRCQRGARRIGGHQHRDGVRGIVNGADRAVYRKAAY